MIRRQRRRRSAGFSTTSRHLSSSPVPGFGKASSPLCFRATGRNSLAWGAMHCAATRLSAVQSKSLIGCFGRSSTGRSSSFSKAAPMPQRWHVPTSRSRFSSQYRSASSKHCAKTVSAPQHTSATVSARLQRLGQRVRYPSKKPGGLLQRAAGTSSAPRERAAWRRWRSLRRRHATFSTGSIVRRRSPP